jgi:hypothetical protein
LKKIIRLLYHDILPHQVVVKTMDLNAPETEEDGGMASVARPFSKSPFDLDFNRTGGSSTCFRPVRCAIFCDILFSPFIISFLPPHRR